VLSRNGCPVELDRGCNVGLDCGRGQVNEPLVERLQQAGGEFVGLGGGGIEDESNLVESPAGRAS